MDYKALQKKKIQGLMSLILQEYENKNVATKINGMNASEFMKKYESEKNYEQEVKIFEEDYNHENYLKSLNSEKDSDDESYSTKFIKRLSNISVKLSENSRRESSSLDKLLNNIPFQRKIRKGFNTLQHIAFNLKQSRKGGFVYDFEEMKSIIKNKQSSPSKSHYEKRKRYMLPQVPLPNSIFNTESIFDNETDQTYKKSPSSDFNIKLYRCNEFRFLSSKLINLIRADSSSSSSY
jgi:hypothetical protein